LGWIDAETSLDLRERVVEAVEVGRVASARRRWMR